MSRTGTVNELPAYLKDSPPFGECLLARFVPPSYQMHSNYSTQLLISNVMMITVIYAEICAVRVLRRPHLL